MARTQWQQLWRAKEEQRLPHALLFSGMSGTGKAQFAANFAQAMLCQAVTQEGWYCNECHMCRLVAGKAHASLLLIEPEKESGVIKIDQVREVSEFVNQTGLQSAYRIVIINPANQMNINAANALLKTLEEPASHTLIMLITDQLSQLPATVLSRCQHILFPQPNSNEALEWLKKQDGMNATNVELVLNLANGAPLGAMRFIQDGLLDVRQNLFQILYSLSQREVDPLQSAAKCNQKIY